MLRGGLSHDEILLIVEETAGEVPKTEKSRVVVAVKPLDITVPHAKLPHVQTSPKVESDLGWLWRKR